MRDFDVLAQKAASQHGLLTTSQLAEGGFSRRAVDRMLLCGRLERVRRGVVRVAGSPVGWPQDLHAAILAAGGLSLASHRSALRLWGLRDIDDELEIAVPTGRLPRLTGVILHRSVDIQAEDRTLVDGIPVTTAARTLIDSGLIFPDSEVRRLVGQALLYKITDHHELEAIRRRVGERGRNGVCAIDRALESLGPRASVEGADSEPELELRAILNAAGLPDPVAQHPVRVGPRRYLIDLAYPATRVALEYDGFDPHVTPDALERDRSRQNDLLLAGWFVLRYTWADLRRRPTAIVQQVRQALRRVL